MKLFQEISARLQLIRKAILEGRSHHKYSSRFLFKKARILLTDEGKIPKKANRSGGVGGGDLDWTEVVRRAMNKQIVEELWE